MRARQESNPPEWAGIRRGLHSRTLARTAQPRLDVVDPVVTPFWGRRLVMETAGPRNQGIRDKSSAEPTQKATKAPARRAIVTVLIFPRSAKLVVALS